MKYEIYQTEEKFAFFPYDFAISCIEKFNAEWKSHYEKVYTAYADLEGKDTEILEELFDLFNVHQPVTFKARSLSTSDIVVLDDERAYYCDSIGWKRLDK